jgi:hypothetical protein
MHHGHILNAAFKSTNLKALLAIAIAVSDYRVVKTEDAY